MKRLCTNRWNLVKVRITRKEGYHLIFPAHWIWTVKRKQSFYYKAEYPKDPSLRRKRWELLGSERGQAVLQAIAATQIAQQSSSSSFSHLRNSNISLVNRPILICPPFPSTQIIETKQFWDFLQIWQTEQEIWKSLCQERQISSDTVQIYYENTVQNAARTNKQLHYTLQQ